MSNKIVYYLVLFLVVLKVVALYFTSFSLYGDEAQYWLWSSQPSLGYYSKPPLLAWIISVYTKLFGSSFFSLKTFPLLIYFLISFCVYKFCLTLNFKERDSSLCALSFMIIPSVSISSFIISTDLLLLLFWVLSMNKLLKMRKKPSVFGFLLLGLYLGLAFLAKYAALYFLLSFFLLIVFDKKTKTLIIGNPLNLMLFLFSFILVLIPNFYWNLENGWVTLEHTAKNANFENLNLNLHEPIKFLLSQALMIGPVLFVSFFYIIKDFKVSFENKFLLIFSIPIIVIILIESFLVRANANWAAPALISVFILFFNAVKIKSIKLVWINFLTNYTIAIFLFASILVSSNNKMFDRVRGINNFVNEIKPIIKEKDLVISDRIVFSNISYEMRNLPNNIYMTYKRGSEITNHFQMSSPLDEKRGDNFYLIGDKTNISYLLKEKEVVLIKEFSPSFVTSKLRLYEVNFK